MVIQKWKPYVISDFCSTILNWFDGLNLGQIGSYSKYILIYKNTETIYFLRKQASETKFEFVKAIEWFLTQNNNDS